MSAASAVPIVVAAAAEQPETEAEKKLRERCFDRFYGGAHYDRGQRESGSVVYFSDSQAVRCRFFNSLSTDDKTIIFAVATRQIVASAAHNICYLVDTSLIDMLDDMETEILSHDREAETMLFAADGPAFIDPELFAAIRVAACIPVEGRRVITITGAKTLKSAPDEKYVGKLTVNQVMQVARRCWTSGKEHDPLLVACVTLLIRHSIGMGRFWGMAEKIIDAKQWRAQMLAPVVANFKLKADGFDLVLKSPQ